MVAAGDLVMQGEVKPLMKQESAKMKNGGKERENKRREECCKMKKKKKKSGVRL